MQAQSLFRSVGRLVAALAVSGSALAQASPFRLVLATEEYPPYNMSGPNGTVTGISTDIVRALLDTAGYEYEITVYPWARAIALARTQVNTCVYSMSRTPEREALYKWVGPLVSNDWALFARSGASRPQTLDEAMMMRIGSYQGDAIVAFLQTRGHLVDVAPSDDVNPRKLLAGRIDFWATGRLIGQYRLKQQGIEGVEPVLNFNHTEMYLACQIQLPDAQVLKLNQTLHGLEKSGAIKRIYAGYGYTP
ncbi:substrate-binding periplasmic protein [Roseateles saccharophilus]|uniref:Amino acid ABC transporter substrate-binding protein (PAAT family) n=1 Tax=Roseateles saccharophilus TaxID=304 RepID=A0A4R3VDN7_ROSSA|nr:transporter substrate-binding domain-containing protein [Roseateles saccharophilus]TCV02261.1 amino acid ABC transporter substrate-binding protein (PAAT family) [Roseateles saccharophilus]